jgi:hypothetical protein
VGRVPQVVAQLPGGMVLVVHALGVLQFVSTQGLAFQQALGSTCVHAPAAHW